MKNSTVGTFSSQAMRLSRIGLAALALAWTILVTPSSGQDTMEDKPIIRLDKPAVLSGPQNQKMRLEKGTLLYLLENKPAGPFVKMNDSVTGALPPDTLFSTIYTPSSTLSLSGPSRPSPISVITPPPGSGGIPTLMVIQDYSRAYLETLKSDGSISPELFQKIKDKMSNPEMLKKVGIQIEKLREKSNLLEKQAAGK